MKMKSSTSSSTMSSQTNNSKRARGRGKWWFEVSEDGKVQLLTSCAIIMYCEKKFEKVILIKESQKYTSKVKVIYLLKSCKIL